MQQNITFEPLLFEIKIEINSVRRPSKKSSIKKRTLTQKDIMADPLILTKTEEKSSSNRQKIKELDQKKSQNPKRNLKSQKKPLQNNPESEAKDSDLVSLLDSIKTDSEHIKPSSSRNPISASQSRPREVYITVNHTVEGRCVYVDECQCYYKDDRPGKSMVMVESRVMYGVFEQFYLKVMAVTFPKVIEVIIESGYIDKSRLLKVPKRVAIKHQWLDRLMEECYIKNQEQTTSSNKRSILRQPEKKKTEFVLNEVRSGIVTHDMMPSPKKLAALTKEKQKIPKVVAIKPYFAAQYFDQDMAELWSQVENSEDQEAKAIYDALDSLNNLIGQANVEAQTKPLPSSKAKDSAQPPKRRSITGKHTSTDTPINWTGEPGGNVEVRLPADYYASSLTQSVGMQTLVTAASIKKTLQLAAEKYNVSFNGAMNRKGSITLSEKDKLEQLNDIRIAATENTRKRDKDYRNYRVAEYQSDSDYDADKIDNSDAMFYKLLIDPKTGMKLKKAKTDEMNRHPEDDSMDNEDVQSDINNNQVAIYDPQNQISGHKNLYCLSQRHAQKILTDVEEILPPKLNRSYRSKYLTYKNYNDRPRIIQKVFIKVDDDDEKKRQAKSLDYGKIKLKDDEITIATFDTEKAKVIPTKHPVSDNKRPWIKEYQAIKYPFLMQKILKGIVKEEVKKEQDRLKGKMIKAEPNSLVTPVLQNSRESLLDDKVNQKRQETVLTKEELHKLYETKKESAIKTYERNTRVQRITGATNKEYYFNKLYGAQNFEDKRPGVSQKIVAIERKQSRMSNFDSSSGSRVKIYIDTE